MTPWDEVQHPARRRFLRDAVLLAGGLVIGFRLPEKGGRAWAAEEAAAGSAKVYPPNAFIRIAADDSVTLIVNKSEMGQGVYTSLPMLINEELDAPWERIRVEAAPVAAVYNHTQYGIQLTGGSTSVASSWEQLRRVGASARMLLVQAAAQRWGVPASACKAEDGRIFHPDGRTSLSYGEVAEEAGKLPLPAEVPLKDPKHFKWIGKSLKRLDTPEKISGKAIFGIDVRLPDMVTVLVARSPVFGGKLKRFDATEALKVPGVVGVYQVPTGVAVAATGFWPAKTARDLLQIEWDEGEGASLSTAKLREEYFALARTPGAVARRDGDVAAGLKAAVQQMRAEYEVPYLAHAPMEPLNVTVDLRPDHCTIWTGTQSQTLDRMAAAAAAGLQPEEVEIHTTYLGGGFGRRANPHADFVTEAVQVAKAVGKPVQVIWTREDDLRGGYYRPMWVDVVEAGIGKGGKPVAWKHTLVGQSIMEGTAMAAMIKDGVDASSVEGAANLPYLIPNIQVELHSPKNAVPVQWWRSVGHSHTAFVVETMIDELAHLARQDPVKFRLNLLPRASRHRAVLQLAAQKAGWGKVKPAPGHAFGVAVHESFGSVVAEVAEVSLEGGQVRVHRVVAAVDCGRVINPDGVVQQIEGGIVYGLAAALYGEITLENGRPVQSNFHDYPILRHSEMPRVEVHLVPSEASPSGVGEPGTPPIAPAVANALFALTGKRVRRLPFARESLA
ncbi:MAG: xanthine dehydrogenase family protein molybdopterin-binding subunit [Rhodocyclales bacterium]|nr:xanthine dehydrogenase family protein molybdopterin-binding subunit [Rhodocyclales bacterium]